MFCTWALRHLGLRGRNLRGKRASNSESVRGGSTGHESGRQEPHRRRAAHAPPPFRGCYAAAGIPPGGPVTPRWRRAGQPCSCMPWPLPGARLTCGGAASGLISTKGADGDGGLHDRFEHDDLGGEDRRWACEHRRRYPACVAAHLSLQSKIMRPRSRFGSTAPRPKILNLRTGSDEMPGGCQGG